MALFVLIPTLIAQITLVLLFPEESRAQEEHSQEGASIPVYSYYVAPVNFTLKVWLDGRFESEGEISIGFQQYRVEENPLSPGSFVTHTPDGLPYAWSYLREASRVSSESLNRQMRWQGNTIHLSKLSEELLRGRTLEGETVVGLNIWAYEDDGYTGNEPLLGFHSGINDFRTHENTTRATPKDWSSNLASRLPRDLVNLSGMEWKSVDDYFFPEDLPPIRQPLRAILHTPDKSDDEEGTGRGQTLERRIEDFWFHEGLRDYENLSVARFVRENDNIRIVIRVYRLRNREVP